MDDRPIGVFDSGLGGLTVLKEIRARLPHENIIYFGDCGRTPYGIKSRETIERYTFQNTRFFLDSGVKMLVIACNTASAYAYGAVSAALDIPVIEVVRPGSAVAAKTTRNGKVGVIGTPATIASRVYEAALREADPRITVFQKACPLFVPLVEEGRQWWNHEATKMIAREYLDGFCGSGIDSLVLGCTHYPLLADVIGGVVGGGIALISSAGAVADEARRVIAANGIGRDGALPGEVAFYTSDSVEKFVPLCTQILGGPVNPAVRHLDIEEYESRLP